MAVDTFPLVQDQRLIAAKIETTTGTAETLAAADGAFNAYMTSDGIEDLTEVIQRQGEGSSSMLPSVPGARWGRLAFAVDLVGSGGAGQPGWATTLLLACGLNNSSGTFSPITGETQADTVTLGYYVDGLLQSLAGAMGTFTIPLVTGQPSRVEFEFWGVIQTESDTALLAPTFPTVIPPRWAGTTNTYDSYALKASRATFTLNNDVQPREDPSVAAGIRSAVIVHREPSVELDPEASLVATKNWQTMFYASTEGALSLVIGTAANNIITIASTKAQVVACPMANRNGIMTRNLRLQLNRNGSTYDSDFTIVFT